MLGRKPEYDYFIVPLLNREKKVLDIAGPNVRRDFIPEVSQLSKRPPLFVRNLAQIWAKENVTFCKQKLLSQEVKR